MRNPSVNAGTPQQLLGGRYELREQIAEGTMASVWRASDHVLGREVATKLLHRQLAEDAAFAARFRQEAVSAANLNHPGIVAVFDTGTHHQAPYIVMELVEGASLRSLLRSTGRLRPARAARIAADVAAALAHAHRAGVVHRDIKPANILLTNGGEVKVTDFSIAKAAGDEEITRTGEIVGTAGYLAPEQINGAPLDGRADVYALGVCLYEMLTGKQPFAADSTLETASAHLGAPVPSVRKTRRDVPTRLDTIVRTAMAKDPAHRFPDAQQMADALESVADPIDTAMLDPVTGPTSRRMPSRAAVTSEQERYRSHPPGYQNHAARTDRRTRQRVGLVVGALILLLVVVGGGAAVLGDGFGDRTAISTDDGDTDGAGQDGSPVTLTSGTAFDPFGSDGENDELAGNVVDGDPDTAWKTSTYRDSLSAISKQGVGIAVEAESPVAASRVEALTTSPGGTALVYGGNQAPAASARDLSGWTALGDSETLGERTVFELDADQEFRYYLVWFTDLPAVEGGFRAEVTAITVRS